MSLTLLLWAFQSTRPMRGGTFRRRMNNNRLTFQSTRPVRGGTIGVTTSADMIRGISIHPPRAGRDPIFEKQNRV